VLTNAAPLPVVAPLSLIAAPVVPIGAPSTFLSGLKANQAALASLFAQQQYDAMIILCRNQEALFDAEVAAGNLSGPEREVAGNGMLLYLYRLSQAHTARQAFSDAAAVSARFSAAYSTLPLMLQGLESNIEMHCLMRYNAGLALQNAGQLNLALQQLQAAAAMVDDSVRVRSATVAASGPGTVPAVPSGSAVPLRSEVCSALGNLLTQARDLAQAALWHAKAVANEDLRVASGAPRPTSWNIYHSAASTAIQRGDFATAVQLDSKAIALHKESVHLPRYHVPKRVWQIL
jgi:tetratricopeptide (TPR) repeat protein